jgi:ketosteroid isomerase-like protein
MEIEKLQEWVTTDRAGFSGLWTLDIVDNDSLLAKYKGAFTCNWKKSKNEDWKISNVHIHHFTE